MIDTGKAIVLDLPPGDAGTDATVAAVWGLIDAAQSDPRLHGVASRALEEFGPGPLSAVFGFGKARVQFVRDPHGWDTMRTVTAILDDIERDGVAKGDCVHRATLLASMLVALGMTPRLVVVGAQPFGAFQHIAAAADLSGVTYPIDPQECSAPGVLPPHKRRKVYDRP